MIISTIRFYGKNFFSNVKRFSSSKKLNNAVPSLATFPKLKVRKQLFITLTSSLLSKM